MATDGTMTAGTTSTRRPELPGRPMAVPRRLRFAGREVPWWAAVLVLYAVSRLLTTMLMLALFVTAIIYTFVASWNEFAASLVILSTDANQPLSVALTKFVGQYDAAWQYVFAVSVVAVIPVVILFMLIEKRLVGGLTAGSVK
jgi:hypothetical protein